MFQNSIRHNLSLHNRFMRVQNEGTGKSSWWMINPDAKPGKSVRRRAASMETSKFEKRRGRVKKKVEALRNGLTADATPSPSSSVSEGLDLFPDSPLHRYMSSSSSSSYRKPYYIQSTYVAIVVYVLPCRVASCMYVDCMVHTRRTIFSFIARSHAFNIYKHIHTHTQAHNHH